MKPYVKTLGKLVEAKTEESPEAARRLLAAAYAALTLGLCIGAILLGQWLALCLLRSVA